MINTILFDFDGTLVNTNDVIIESFKYTFKHYLGIDVPVSKITTFFGEPLVVTMAREFPEVDSNEAIETYRTYQTEHADKLVKSFEGVPEMLQDLKDSGFRLAIVTSRTTKSTLNYLKMFDLQDFFEEIISCDDTKIHKPEPEPIYCALRKLGIEKDEAIMVGDGPFDVKCANNAGVKSALVGWRITSDKNEVVGEIRPDYEIKKPEDMIKLLERIC